LISVISRRWVLRVSATFVGAWGVAGCAGYSVTATDGRVFAESDNSLHQLASALSASASHDLPCAGTLEVRRLAEQRQYVVAGCGSLAIYEVDTPSIGTRRLELVSHERESLDGERPALDVAAKSAPTPRVETGAVPRSASSPPPA
jgi:hypothetical protein